MVRVVVLLGPPASGKSAVGQELERAGFRWREWEQVILDRWGSRDAFVAVKDVALPELQREIRSWIDSDGPVAVIETTGLSDAAFLDSFERDQMSFVVRLDVSEEEALRRAAARPSGHHLTDDLEINRLTSRAFATRVAPHRRIDLCIDTERVEPAEAARLVADAIDG
jgi:dephospho-CoA kinase